MFGNGDNLAFRPVLSMVAEREAIFSAGGNVALPSDCLCPGSFGKERGWAPVMASLLLTEAIKVE